VHLSTLIKDYWLGADAGPIVSRPPKKKEETEDRR